MAKYYCENCGKDINKGYGDRLGSVFCSKTCYLQSSEYRKVGVVHSKEKLKRLS